MNNAREFRIKQLNSLLSDSPNDPFLRYALALEFLNSENFPLAEEKFLALIDDSPEYTATYYHLAKLYEQTQQREKAINTYKKGIKITQKVKDLHALSELRSALNELEFDE